MKHYIIRITQSIKRQNSAVKNKALIPLKRGLLTVKQGLAEESRQTKTMLITYQRFTKGQASKLEMEEANKQFIDVIRGLGLGVLAILPFSPITLPFVVKLGERIGVNVLPSAFMIDPQENEVIDIQQEVEVIVESASVIRTADDKL
ncbi:hypothetical protein [uncultured Paraglaciecola sp.]|uniref:hypothetical protein n=1 Tax=uncultured Paraglaciecola sp. TaxID=1765024 RepID=UPI002603AC55|nr:hypothetical protein [uncultured Paraglaciecola sp.]